MSRAFHLTHDQPSLMEILGDLDASRLDEVEFGLLGFDADGLVQRYNRFESGATGLDPARVIGKHLFTAVAQRMNNYLVAQRFEDAAAAGTPLDATIDYVLTWCMRPTRVKLRLLYAPGAPLR